MNKIKKIFIIYAVCIIISINFSSFNIAKENRSESIVEILIKPRPSYLAGNIYVDDNNTVGPWDGTIMYPYQFIQDAVDNAKNFSTIYVASGIYYENVKVNKSIYLCGENYHTTIIDGGGFDSVITVTIQLVTIKGFRIQNNMDLGCKAGIAVEYVDNCWIIGNKIVDTYWTAIYIRSSHYNKISNNKIINNYGSGIELCGSNNIVDNNTVNANVGSGMTLTGGSCVVSDNKFNGNDCWGVFVWNSPGDNIIKRNVFYNNARQGVFTYNSYCSYIYNNDFVNNTEGNAAQAYSINVWDNGFPGGGNYWSDFEEHHGPSYDLFTGPNQNIPGHDGIIDQGGNYGGLNPYVIIGRYQDFYPLAHPLHDTLTQIGTTPTDDIE